MIIGWCVHGEPCNFISDVTLLKPGGVLLWIRISGSLRLWSWFCTSSNVARAVSLVPADEIQTNMSFDSLGSGCSRGNSTSLKHTIWFQGCDATDDVDWLTARTRCLLIIIWKVYIQASEFLWRTFKNLNIAQKDLYNFKNLTLTVNSD